MKSIIILIDYFGSWPEWFPIFLESCRHNPTINWLFHTDCPCDLYNVENVKFRYISKEDYIRQVSDKLRIRFTPGNDYKFNDLKPMLGILHEDEIQGYDFFGYGDIDLIYGDIRKFYTDKVLKNNVISTHIWCVSGHLALIRNKKWLRNAFRKYKQWKKIMEEPHAQRFDEDMFSRIFKYPETSNRIGFFLYDLANPLSIKYRKKLYFKEQYTTPLTSLKWRNARKYHPTVWFWKDGRITDALHNGQEYIYLHFMNYKVARYMDPVYGTEAFWSRLPVVVHVKPEDLYKGVRIDRYGFHVIEK